MSNDCSTLARQLRIHVLNMIHRAKASHVATCLSMVDLLAVLYGKILRVDASRSQWPERDHFILSKGHGAAALYAVLAEQGFFPKEWLNSYCREGSVLAGHVVHNGVPGVEASTGSLGHGLPIACGLALAGKRDGRSYRVFVLLSDGELDEGSNWEAILFAGHHRLDNLVAIVDYNKIQSFGAVREVLDLEPLADKWRAFRWAVRELDGHNHQQIEEDLGCLPFEEHKPSVLIAHTIKGKGVAFMENSLLWHYKSPDEQQVQRAITDINCGP